MNSVLIVLFYVLCLCKRGDFNFCTNSNLPYKTETDNNCANFNQICVKTDDKQCKNFMDICAQCPLSDHIDLMLRDLLNKTNGVKNEVKAEFSETAQNLRKLKTFLGEKQNVSGESIKVILKEVNLKLDSMSKNLEKISGLLIFLSILILGFVIGSFVTVMLLKFRPPKQANTKKPEINSNQEEIPFRSTGQEGIVEDTPGATDIINGTYHWSSSPKKNYIENIQTSSNINNDSSLQVALESIIISNIENITAKFEKEIKDAKQQILDKLERENKDSTQQILNKLEKEIKDAKQQILGKLESKTDSKIDKLTELMIQNSTKLNTVLGEKQKVSGESIKVTLKEISCKLDSMSKNLEKISDDKWNDLKTNNKFSSTYNEILLDSFSEKNKSRFSSQELLDFYDKFNNKIQESIHITLIESQIPLKLDEILTYFNKTNKNLNFLPSNNSEVNMSFLNDSQLKWKY